MLLGLRFGESAKRRIKQANIGRIQLRGKVQTFCGKLQIKKGGWVAGLPEGETKTKQGVPPFCVQMIAGLGVLCEFMVFGGSFGPCSARCAGDGGTGAEASRSLRFEGWIRGLPPIRDETADGWGTRRFERRDKSQRNQGTVRGDGLCSKAAGQRRFAA